MRTQLCFPDILPFCSRLFHGSSWTTPRYVKSILHKVTRLPKFQFTAKLCRLLTKSQFSLQIRCFQLILKQMEALTTAQGFVLLKQEQKGKCAQWLIR